MELKMKVYNFGVINEAEMDLNQINIIAGINSSGKSTLSKLLYSYLASLSSLKNKLVNRDKISIFNQIIKEIKFNSKIENLDNNNDKLINISNRLNNIKQDIYEDHSSEYEEICNKLENILDQIFEDNKTSNKIKDKIIPLRKTSRSNVSCLNEILGHEFGMLYLMKQGNEVSHESNIIFNSVFGENKHSNEIHISSGMSVGGPSYNDRAEIGYDVFYIDSQQNLNVSLRCFKYPEFYSVNTPLHTAELFDIITTPRSFPNMEKYYKKIDMGDKLKEIIHGEIIFDTTSGDFKYHSKGNSYKMHNSASGIKQIGILQYLLSNCIIKENNFLLIDEPEVNLHPKWQLKLAEFIVLLSKELKIVVFINSHSPFFIEAIETYSKHHDMEDYTTFYLSQESEKTGLFNITKIEVEEIDQIYKNLGDSFNLLNEIRFEDMGL